MINYTEDKLEAILVFNTLFILTLGTFGLTVLGYELYRRKY